MEEPVTLSADRQSIPLISSVANSGGVLLLANDTTYIPREGVQNPAILTSDGPGPYRIERCVGTNGPLSNRLVITTNAGSVAVDLPTGISVTTDTIIRTLKSSTRLVFPREKNGVLEMVETQSKGEESFIRLSGKGADVLGFTQKGDRGVEVYPPWGLSAITRTYTAAYGPLRAFQQKVWQPKFIRPILSNPTLKVTYVAPPNECPRCNGTYVENDYRFNTEGEPIIIQDSNLLYQMCLKAILTEKGSNPFHPTYGCGLLSHVGAKRTFETAMAMRDDIETALRKIKSLQQQQRKYQLVSGGELLYAVNGVDVRPNPNDPTTFLVDVGVQNGSNKPLAISITFTVPGAVALGGSTGKPLGLDATGLEEFESTNFINR